MKNIIRICCVFLSILMLTSLSACGQLSKVFQKLQEKKNAENNESSTSALSEESISQSSPGETSVPILSEIPTSETTPASDVMVTDAVSEASYESTTQQPVVVPTTDNPPRETETEASIEDIIAGIEGIPAFGSGMFLDPSDPNRFSPLVYSGTDFMFYYQISAGDMSAEYGLGFMLNGIYQDIRVEGKDLQTGYDIMHIVSVPARSTKVFKVFLRPNIGRAGETLKFTNATIVNPNKRVTNQNETYSQQDLSLEATLSSPFIMQSDSTETAEVCTGFSGEAHNPYHRNIRAAFNLINNTGELCQILLGTDVDSMVTYDTRDRNYLTDPRITLNRSAAAQIKIVLGGGKYGTTQRVSLYVNGEPLPVFDGKLYADVSVDRTNQTELTVFLDTSKLPEWNGIYLLAYTMDDSTLSSPVAFRKSDSYVLHVEG